MSEFDISQTHIAQRLQSLDNTAALLRIFAEKGYRLIDTHIENIAARLATILHLQDLIFEAFTVTSLAGERDIRHKLHRHLDSTLALTHLATPSRRVEREVRCGDIVVLGVWLLGKEFSYLVPRLDIDGRV